MATGAEFAAFKNKMLIGFEDLGTRALGYLTQLHRESVQAKWDRDGVFNIRLTLGGSAADTVQVEGASKSTDGGGHLFDLASISSSESRFENANTVVYYVGFFYSEVPLGIRINPRDAKPEYTGYREEIGRSGSPNTVVANGNGTITFKVNSVTEAGVSNVGRTVCVFKNVLATGAIATSIAIEECTVAFASGDNTITTVGTLGQSPVSTVAGDYTVVLMGASVTRNTDLRAESGCFFIGTVTGNGSGNTPATFSNTDQFVFKTFEDASQIAYVPTEWLTATNLQDAVDELLDGLLATVPETSGSQRIGVDGASYTKKAVDLSEPMTTALGGIGNVADETLTADPKVGEVLTAIDEAVQRIRVFSATVGDGSRLSDKDATTGPNDATKFGGAYFFRRLHNSAAMAYTVTNPSTDSVDVSPYILGEQSSPVAPSVSLGADRTVIKFDRSDNLQYVPPGKYERVFLDSVAADEALFVNGYGSAPGGTFEDVLIRGGNFTVQGADLSRGDGALQFRGAVFDSLEGTARANGSTVLFSSGSGEPVHGHFENSIFYGPLPEQATPLSLACIHLAGIGTTRDLDRPLTFDNCVFIGRRTDIPVLLCDEFVGHHVVFNNCYFLGASGGLMPVVIVKGGGNCVFNDCTIVAPEGQALEITQGDGAACNCQIITGDSGSVVAEPIVVRVSGGTRGFRIEGMSVVLDTSAVRPDTSEKALIVLGSGADGLITGNVTVDGLHVRYKSSIGLHNSDTIVMYGSTGPSSFSNVTLECNGNTRTGAGVPYSAILVDSGVSPVNCIVSIIGVGPVASPKDKVFVQNLKVENFSSPSANYPTAIVGVTYGSIRGLVTRGSINGSGCFKFATMIGEHGMVDDYQVADDGFRYVAVLGFIADGGKCNELQLTGSPDNAYGGRVVSMIGNQCELTKASLALGETGWDIVIALDGNECLIADGTYSCTATDAKWSISGSRNIIRGMRGSWDATVGSLFNIYVGVSNMIIGNAFARLAGAAALIHDDATGTVVANNIP